MYISLRIFPGWAGLCIRPELSMIVFINHLIRVAAVEAEGHAVIFINPNGITIAVLVTVNLAVDDRCDQ
jgi:hypothetical protein